MKRAQKIRYVVAGIFATSVLAGTSAAQNQPQPYEPGMPPGQPGQQQQPKQEEPKPHGDKEAKEQEPNEVMAAKKMSAMATVEKVDKKNRQLTLKDADGDRFKVNVSEDVKKFDAIKKGDKISVDYYTSVALSLMKGESGKEPSAEETKVGARAPGQLPGGLVGKRISATVEVMNVNKEDNKVTLKGPNGIDTIHVTDPELQGRLDNLKKGDKIKAEYTEAVAVEVTPQKKQKSS